MTFLGRVTMGFVVAQAGCLWAATKAAEDEIPPLRPPRGELPPGFWDLYAGWVIAGAVVLLALIGVIVWWWRKPRAALVIPPEIQARTALDQLAAQPENGIMLSRVSQVVRRYVSGAFTLSEGEMTTSDLRQAMRARQEVSPQIAESVDTFLTECDTRKFAPQPSQSPFGAVEKARTLIQMVEQCRHKPAQGEETANGVARVADGKNG